MENKTSTLRRLREKGVGPNRDALAKLKEQRQIRKKIAESLKSGAKTIPEIADETQLPSPVVTWYIMTMRKYGQIEEEGEEGGYYRYRLVEGEENED
ncbi:hypothetical protein [Archaeoglobus neptunius]|uniref:hypothetical protein n=1 Tax=Archaeoglobus neptunius TaxID=2798580 RepID=UPI001926C319|nr:hypothetical protein [Archaeoglobus neptunius]